MIDITRIVSDIFGEDESIDLENNEFNEDTVPQDLDEWLSRMEKREGYLEDLAGNFRYLSNNVEDYENGEINPEDLPNLSKFEKYAIMNSVVFGTSIYPMMADFYEIKDQDGFVGLYSDESEAYNMLKDNCGGNIRSVNVDSSFDPYDFIEKHRENGLEEFADSLDTCYKWVRESDLNEGDLGMDECPIETDLTRLVGYSVLFGMNWEREVPSVYAVYDSTGIHRLCVGKPEKTPESGEVVAVEHIRNL